MEFRWGCYSPVAQSFSYGPTVEEAFKAMQGGDTVDAIDQKILNAKKELAKLEETKIELMAMQIPLSTDQESIQQAKPATV